jgi:hypothetical protein
MRRHWRGHARMIVYPNAAPWLQLEILVAPFRGRVR